eukprot:6466815-Alexandrium_andersonii.AAC.1
MECMGGCVQSMHVRLPASMLACVRACLSACVLACARACACLLVGLPACARAGASVHPCV